MSDQKVKTLGDYFTLQRGTTYESKLLGLPGPLLLGLGTIQRNGGFRGDSLKTYGGESPEKLLVYPGELYVSLKDVTQSADLLGAVARLPRNHAPGRLTQDTVKLEKKNFEVPIDYLYWVMRTPAYRSYCRGCATGTTNLGLSREDFLSYKVTEPTEAQSLTIRTLDALEDKIELNRRMNETLEAMARAIFQSWFVDFDPVRAKASGEPAESICQRLGLTPELLALFPDSFEDSELGEIPTGWSTTRLSEIAEIIMGQSPNGDTYNELGDGMPLINGPVEFGTFHPLRRKWTTNPIRTSEQGDLVVCVRGSTTGRHVKSDGIYCLGRGVASIRSRFGNQSYVDQVFKQNLEGMLTHATGSTFPSWSGPTLKQWPIILPPEQLMMAYQAVAGPLTNYRDDLADEVETLVETRDTLLPKLLSGGLSCVPYELIHEHA